MKVFWSWQSDTPGKIGRHFVREALSDAVDQIKRDISIQEPTERASREDLHLDHDRKGVAGSPELFRTILEKIEQSAAVVADVTPVGVVNIGDEKEKFAKKLINSNVGIEIGYTLRALSDGALLMVMNENYGSRNDLPFDLKSKAGPIIFNLSPKASAAEIRAEKTLTATLAEAIKLCLASHTEQKRQEIVFPKAKSTLTAATFYQQHGEVLASFGDRGEQEYRIDPNPLFYLRFHPTHGGQSVGLKKMKEAFDARRIDPMTLTVGGLPSRNRYGPIMIDPLTQKTIKALTQGFETGELWGVNSKLTITERQQDVFSGDVRETIRIPLVNLEQTYVRTLLNYIRVSERVLNLRGPFTVEMGAMGIKGVRLASPWHGVSDQIFEDGFRIEFQLKAEQDAMKALGAAITAFYDKFAVSRPEIIPDEFIASLDFPPKS